VCTNLTRFSLLVSPRRSRSPKQISCLDTENTSEPVYHIDSSGIDAAFQRTDIGAIDLRTMGKLFLRKALSPPEFPQIERQYFSYFHLRDDAVL